MPERPTRVVLVGFMGSGKTSVGRVLARRLGYGFEDMDRRIEERTGRAVADIFREEGEEAFREMEREEAQALTSLPQRVVATGGGAFTRPATRALLQEGALTVWLRCDLDQMLARVDIVSVNAPHTPATFHLLNARRLKLLKPSAVVINTSRGEVIDENALTRGLRSGEIAGAGLDVYEHGAEINPRLRELPNVVLLPHMGSATLEGRVEMGEKVIINIKTFADGHRPPDLVVPGML